MGKIKTYILKNRFLYNISRTIIDEISTIHLECWIEKYKKNPEKVKEKLLKKGKFVSINKGKYNYKTFSAFYLNNMLALILKNLLKGNIPIVNYTTSLTEDKSNNWMDFFKQPIELKEIETQNYIIEKCNNCRFKPAFSVIYFKKKLKLWCYIYKEFIKLNDEMTNYIEEEYTNILKGKKVLGVICRGTDYISTKPKYHPIQPNIEDVIKEAERLLNESKYQYIYLATEDESYYKLFVSKFGHDKILTNKRTYYDKLYNELDKSALLHSVNFERENDQYQKGKEYLSSIVLLSKCDAIIGGHCGGSDLALFFINCKYEYVHIYNCGTY